jgi:Phosphate-induced protein 1 conserved region
MRGVLGLCTLSGLSALMVSACVGAPDVSDEASEGQQGSSEVRDLQPTGREIGTADNFAKPTGQAVSTNITLHGGPVMLGTVNVYYIWYGNWTGNTATSILTDFASNLGGSPYWNINTTYKNTAGTAVSNSLVYKGSTTDNYSKGTALTDANIATIVTSAITTGALPSDANGIYFVLTSADVNATSGFCTQYCGWHTHATIGGTDIKYSFVGNPDRCPSNCAAQTVGPNGNAGADGMASILAHEAEETVTDPDLNAWYDKTGYENADKCAWKFGTTYTVNGAMANMKLGTRNFLIQQNWKAGTSQGCALSYP